MFSQSITRDRGWSELGFMFPTLCLVKLWQRPGARHLDTGDAKAGTSQERHHGSPHASLPLAAGPVSHFSCRPLHSASG